MLRLNIELVSEFHPPLFFSAVDRFLMVRIHVRQPGFVISYLQEALMLLWEVFAPPFG